MDLQCYQKHDMLGYYQLMQVPPSATASEIRRSYYALALLYHPDKNNSPEAAVMFKAIVQAYGVLSDPEKRRQYDAATYSLGTDIAANDADMPSFVFGYMMGNIFLFGWGVGIIVVPLWAFFGPMIVTAIAVPVFAKDYTKLVSFCVGALGAPLMALATSMCLVWGASKRVVNLVTGAVTRPRQIEDIEDGWINVDDD